MLFDQDSYIFTSESVSEGHPDKVCDRISDEILDLILTADPKGRAAIEVLATTDQIILAGEMRAPDEVTLEALIHCARQTVRAIGYRQKGFHWKTLDIKSFIHAQSEDIAIGVDGTDTKEQGAGDQGIMFGYACNETPVLMPAPIFYAHNILKKLNDDRHSGIVPWLRPDAKSQVSLKYHRGMPVGISSLVVSTQHDELVEQTEIRSYVKTVLEEIFPSSWMCSDDQIYVNPTGRFIIGGPDGDTGLTGRKIIVDTYGGAAPHGGGAFSGKDPTKVDRSAAYAARYLAKNIVASGLAERCLIQLSYAIGVSHPLSIFVNCFGTARVDEQAIIDAIPNFMSLSPKGIRKHLGLNCPIYARTSSFGHFGRDPQEDGGFSWEKTDLVLKLKTHFGL